LIEVVVLSVGAVAAACRGGTRAPGRAARTGDVHAAADPGT